MVKNEQAEKILRDLRKANLKVNTLINEISRNIVDTRREIKERDSGKK